jgi:hypothetical protein
MDAAVKKEISIDIFVVLFTALLFWLLVSTNILVDNLALQLLLIFALPIWISCLAIALALVSNYSAIILNILIPVILIIFGIPQVEIIVAAIIIIALLASARLFFVRELKSRIEYKTRYTFYSGTKLLIMVVIVIITGISMPHIMESLMSDEALIPESSVRLILKPYEPYIASSVPGGSFDMSINQAIADQPSAQTQQDVPLMERRLIGSENISSVITSVLNDQIKSLSHNYPIITPIIIFALVVLVSRLLIPIFALFLLLLIAFFIWLSRQSKLINLISVSKPVEHLEL